jgi:hypothetical protein
VILRDLHEWLSSLSGAAPDPLVALPETLTTIDFAAPGAPKRDRYVIEGARRTFERTTMDIARWEWNFVDTAGLFGDEFRRRAEDLRTFVSEIGSFLEGMERYILREQPTSPARAFDGITELTEERALYLAGELQDFLRFYRELCESYGVSASTAAR